MRRVRANHFTNRSRIRRQLPWEIAAALIRSLDLCVEDRDLALGLSALWVGANDVLAAAAGPRAPIGELLVKIGRLTRPQLESVLADQGESGMKLGEILVRKGWLTTPELRAILAFQQRLGNAGAASAGPLQLGNLLVTTGKITPAQLEQALLQQRQSKQRLGDTLVGAGYLTEHHVEHGLRLQQMMVRLALSVLLAMSLQSFPASAAAGGAAYGAITMSATVLPYHRLDVVRQSPTLTVTPSDVARGYVDVPAGTALRARSNDRQGFTVSFDPRMKLFKRATITGLGGAVDIGAAGGAAYYAYAGRDKELELSYRFYLEAGLAPGSYPWPLRISSSVTY
jgi:hypothetical protein